MSPESRRQELASTLAAMDAALADPTWLVTLLADAEDDQDAAQRLRATLGLSADEAATVLEVSGLPDGPERCTVLPSRSASFDHSAPESG